MMHIEATPQHSTAAAASAGVASAATTVAATAARTGKGHLQHVMYLFPSTCEKRLTVSAVCTPRVVQELMNLKSKLDHIFDTGKGKSPWFKA